MTVCSLPKETRDMARLRPNEFHLFIAFLLLLAKTTEQIAFEEIYITQLKKGDCANFLDIFKSWHFSWNELQNSFLDALPVLKPISC